MWTVLEIDLIGIIQVSIQSCLLLSGIWWNAFLLPKAGQFGTAQVTYSAIFLLLEAILVLPRNKLQNKNVQFVSGADAITKKSQLM